MKRRVLFALESYDEVMHRGVAAYAKEHGWYLRAVTPSSGPLYRYWDGDGIITFSLGSESDLAVSLRAMACPKVALSLYPAQADMASVGEDAYAIGDVAGEYLSTKGYRHVVFMSETDSSHIELMADGFASHFPDSTVERWFLNRVAADWHGKTAWLGKRLREMSKPLAVFCNFDYQAEWLLHVCLETGLRVPDDVAILGAANHEMVSALAKIPISSVDTNRFSWAYTAAGLLDDILDGKAAGNSRLLIKPLHVVERRSTDCIAVSDERVRLAVATIKRSLAAPVSIESIAERCGVPRTTLSRLFKQTLGRTINQEIIRCRLDEAKRLLRDSDLSGIEISQQCGFGSSYYFYKIFRANVGITTREYRQEVTGCQSS